MKCEFSVLKMNLFNIIFFYQNLIKNDFLGELFKKIIKKYVTL